MKKLTPKDELIGNIISIVVMSIVVGVAFASISTHIIFGVLGSIMMLAIYHFCIELYRGVVYGMRENEMHHL